MKLKHPDDCYYRPNCRRGYAATAWQTIKAGFARLALISLILVTTIMPILPQQAAFAVGSQSIRLTMRGMQYNSENLTNYPAHIVFESGWWDWTKANSDGSDIHFYDSDNATELTFEWDVSYNGTAHTGSAYVKIPQANALTTNDSIIVSSGGAVNAPDPQHVWGSWQAIDYAEATTNWTGHTLALSSDNVQGTYSISDNLTTQAGVETFTTVNPAGSWDFSDNSTMLSLWVKQTIPLSSLTTERLYITDSIGNYRYWNMESQGALAANAWVNIIRQASTGDGGSATPPNLASIDAVQIGVNYSGNITNSAPTFNNQALNDGQLMRDSNNWPAQTFQVTSNVTITAIKVRAGARIGSPTSLIAHIRPVNGSGQPTASGTDITTGTYDATTLDTGSYLWIRIPLAAPLKVSTNTSIALVFSATGTDVNNSFRLADAWNTGTYASGAEYLSTNGGDVWTTYPNSDMLFEVDSDFNLNIDYVEARTGATAVIHANETGGTVAYDSSRYGNNVIFTGNTGTSFYQSTINFTGTQDWGAYFANDSNRYHGKDSTEIWYKSGGFTGAQREIYYSGYNVDPYGFDVYLEAGQNVGRLKLRNTAGTVAFPTSAHIVNTWNDIAWSWNGTYLYGFENGMPQSAREDFSGYIGKQGTGSVERSRLGAYGNANQFDGQIDEFRNYPDALSASWLYADELNRRDVFFDYGNSNPPLVTSNTPSGLSMDKNGVVSGNFSGNLTSLGKESYARINFQYGLTSAYGTNTTPMQTGLNIERVGGAQSLGGTSAAQGGVKISLANGDILSFTSSSNSSYMWRSTDKGVTYSGSQLIVQSDGSFSALGFSPVQSDNGTLWMLYGRYVDFVHDPTACPTWVIQSNDNGYTWFNDHAIITNKTGYPTNIGLPLRNGILLVPYSFQDSAASANWTAGVLRLTLTASDWVLGGLAIGANPTGGHGVDEPSIVELSNGNVYMELRTYSGTNYKSLSTDSGVTFSVPVTTGYATTSTLSAVIRASWVPNRIVRFRDNHASTRWPAVYEESLDDTATWSAIQYLNGDLNIPNHPDTYFYPTRISDRLIQLFWWSYPAQGGSSDDYYPFTSFSPNYIFGDQPAIGVFTEALPVNLTPGQTYHYRAVGYNAGGYGYGSDQAIALTMPSVVTGTPTISQASQTAYHFILNGNISNMGVASDAYYAFRWGYSPQTMTSIVGAGSTAAIGSFSADIGNILAGQPVYYQFYATVGGVESTGDTQNGTGAVTPTVSLDAILPLLILISGIVFTLRAVASDQISGVTGIVLIFIVIAITVAMLTSTNTIVNTP